MRWTVVALSLLVSLEVLPVAAQDFNKGLAAAQRGDGRQG